MVAGYELADTLAILGQWDSLTDDEVRSLGLPGIPVDGTRDQVEAATNLVFLRDRFSRIRNPR
jgi:hypothetical protein